MPVCINCHDLKDRIPLSNHPAIYMEAISDLWKKATPLERIWLAKLYGLLMDANLSMGEEI